MLIRGRFFDQFRGQTILAIDYGQKVTGLAIFTPHRDPFPTPYGRIIYQNDQQLAKEIAQILVIENIEIIVLGLPLHKDGTESEMAAVIRRFAEILSPSTSGQSLYFQDETLTTHTAKERMKNSPQYNYKIDPKKIDELAASIILEDFVGKN